MTGRTHATVTRRADRGDVFWHLVLISVLMWLYIEFHMFVVLWHEVAPHGVEFMVMVVVAPLVLAVAAPWAALGLAAAWWIALRWPRRGAARALGYLATVAYFGLTFFAAAMGA